MSPSSPPPLPPSPPLRVRFNKRLYLPCKGCIKRNELLRSRKHSTGATCDVCGLPVVWGERIIEQLWSNFKTNEAPSASEKDDATWRRRSDEDKLAYLNAKFDLRLHRERDEKRKRKKRRREREKVKEREKAKEEEEEEEEEEEGEEEGEEREEEEEEEKKKREREEKKARVKAKGKRKMEKEEREEEKREEARKKLIERMTPRC